MKCPFRKCKKQTSQASASVVDGKLVLSLPDASTPVVWQMDLDKTKASALEIISNDNQTEHKLGLKTPGGEKIEIATFDNMTYAKEGLISAADALKNAQGQIRPGAVAENNMHPTAYDQPQRRRGGKKWLWILLGIIGIFVALNIWASLSGIPPQGIALPDAPAIENQAGVPMSADEFLRRQ